jgi:hypothetical protein
MYNFDDKLLNLDNFEEALKKILTVKEIMTTDIKYYDSFDNDDERNKFCVDRNIDFLPLKKKLKMWSYKKNIFEDIENKITNSNIFIYDKELINILCKKDEIIFIIENEKLIGLIHFVDYNRKQAYIYPYFKFIEFESLLREYIKFIGKEQDYFDFVNKQSEKKIERIEDTGFIQLLKYIRENKILNEDMLIIKNNVIQGHINDLRNKIMHIKYHTDLIKENRLYDFKKNTEILIHIDNSIKLLKNEMKQL